MPYSTLRGLASGPSATADWVCLATPGEQVPLRALPDVAMVTGRSDATYHVVSDPYIVRNPDGGSPRFTLTLLLSRQPEPGEDSVVPLISGGVCAATFGVVPNSDRLALLRDSAEAEYSALFPRWTTWALLRSQEQLFQTHVEGANGQGALSLTLDRDDALAALAAVTGNSSGLTVQCTLAFRAVGADLPELQVRVDLARAYDVLAARLDSGGMMYEHDLPAALTALIDTGAVSIEGAEGTPAAELARALYVDLVRSLALVLRRVETLSGAAEKLYRLGTRPADQASMNFRRTAGPPTVERSVLLSRSLGDALHEVVSQYSIDALVHLVCPGPDGQVQAVVRRLPAARSGPPLLARASPIASIGPVAAAMPAVLKTDPVGRVNAQSLAVSDLVARPSALRPQVGWAVDDMVIDQVALHPRLRPLPVIEDDAALWRDRIDAARFWYAPELMLVQPRAPATAEASPFLFTFRAVGHDVSGSPGLEATVRLTLRAQMPSVTQADWATRGKPRLEPVPLNGLSASLEIPFRDGQGQTQAQAVTATSLTVTGENIVCTFQLTDQWARLCYGALAIPGFQQQPARVVASYTFSAYVPASDGPIRVDWGGKRAVLPLEGLTRSANGGPATRAAPLASLRMRPTDGLDGGIIDRPHPIRPPVESPPIILQPDEPVLYGIRSQGRTSRLDATVPCNQFGPLYVQATDHGDLPIGCRDAFTLGQIDFRLYEQITVDLGTPQPGFSVFRSLQVPGRYLVLPQAYTIGRFEPGDSRAYRPAIYFFSSVDAVHPERGSCVLMATLQPAVPPFRRQHLLDYLRQHEHPTPTLEWPTDLASTPTYAWAIADAGVGAGQIQPAAVRTPEGFQVSLATSLFAALQLKAIVERSGINAAVQFPLSDGTTLHSTLVIDLARIEGPWLAGPIEAVRSGTSVTLTNRVEQPIDVSDLGLYTANAPGGVVPVERRLAAGESISLTDVAASDALVPDYAAVGGPSSLDEVRTFIEDIYTNVVLMSGVDFAAQGISDITVQAAIVGLAGDAVGHLTPANAVAELRFVLPLTVYLAQPTLRFHAVATRTTGAQTTGPSRDWRLDTLGNVISIGADLLQGG